MALLWKYKGIFIRVLGSTYLIFWILNKIDWNKVIGIVKEGSPFYFLAAFVAIQLTVFSSIVKWKMLVDSSLKADKKRDASFLKLGRLYYIGLFFNNFLPGSVGGDVVRVYYLGRMTGVPIATASVAFERITSGIALVVIAVLSSFSIEAARPYVLTTTLVLGLILILILLVGKLIKTIKSRDGIHGKTTDISMDRWFTKLIKALLKTGEIALNYRKEHFIWWIKIIMLSLLFQVGLAWINDLLFLSIGIDIPWIYLLMIITLISVITMLPISLNGLGVRESCYVFFFKELGVSAETSLTISLLFFIFVSISSLAGGLFWMAERGKHS
ncbi:lysylphosphatidylglycerol synthase transmembrane domain-containing protein [Neobacillus drentensis]|uniref:lysylphosphatidylglycerol synthase transmembrane domain-containing protein n=1 Tax=Neobacillus drentensis TaxID=220684 RepID=UPI003000F261